MRRQPGMSAYATSTPAVAGAASRRTIAIFLGLFIAPGVAQSVLLTVVPLEALRLLGTARAVTLLYVAAGLAAMIGRLSIPLLVLRIQRRLVSASVRRCWLSPPLCWRAVVGQRCLRPLTQQLCICVHRDHQQPLCARPHPASCAPAL